MSEPDIADILRDAGYNVVEGAEEVITLVRDFWVGVGEDLNQKYGAKDDE